MAEARYDSNVDNVESKINRLYHMREEIRRIEAELKAFKTTFRAIENDILDILQDGNLTKLGTDLATVSMSESKVPTVDPDHWEDVWQFIFDNGYMELMRKQLNSTPWAELHKMGIEVPHVTPTAQRKLNLRKAG